MKEGLKMPRKKSSLPKPRLHKPSGRSRVYLNGTYVYLGKWGSKEADREYKRIMLEHFTGIATTKIEYTVGDLVARFLPWADQYYRKPSGRPTGSIGSFVQAFRHLTRLYENLPVTQFSPIHLKAVRQRMINSGLCRKTINSWMSTIKTLFRWGVEEQMVPVNVHQSLLAVRILIEGKTTAPDHPPVTSADIVDVLKTIEHCHQTIADMIRVQLLAGMRPNEVCNMRLCDIDKTDPISWVYIPFEYKTQHHKENIRAIPIIPECQEILNPYLERNEKTPEAFLFKPSEFKHAKKRYGECYSSKTYRHAVVSAIKKAGCGHWSPNQLRHTRATDVKIKYGDEAAQLLLSHKTIKTTKIYIDKDVLRKEAADAARKVGRLIANVQ
jgi:integrase